MAALNNAGLQSENGAVGDPGTGCREPILACLELAPGPRHHGVAANPQFPLKSLILVLRHASVILIGGAWLVCLTAEHHQPRSGRLPDGAEREEADMAEALGTRMTGKVALVTGAASGLGLGAAIALAQQGATVVMTDVAQTDGRDAAQAIAQAGGSAEFHSQDVTQEDVWADLIALIERRHGTLHVLVNNAGIALNYTTLDMSLEDWRRQMAVNVDGVFLGCKHGIPLIARSGGGSVINISSVAGLRGAAGLAGYCASKGAVRLFTKALALECAAAGNRVRVNSVHPGIIETPIWSRMENVQGNLREAMTPAEGANTVDVQMLAPLVPVGTVGTPADIAAGILYLASDDSRYVTGTELVIDGGMTAGS